jgi:hypothetical protein
MALATAPSIPEARNPELAAVIELGLTEARAVPADEGGEDHRAAWLLRLARFDPGAAIARLDELPGDASLRCELYAAAAQARAAGGADPGDHWRAAVRLLSHVPDPETGLHLLNNLCETGIEWAARDAPAGRGLLRELGGPAGEGVPTDWPPPHRALALALLGEALVALDEPAGTHLLEAAIELAAGFAVQDQVLGFAAQTFADRDPARAEVAAAGLADPWLRLEARAGLLRRRQEAGDSCESLLDAARADALAVEALRQCEALARLATVVRDAAPEAARALYEQAVAAVATEPPQLRALQLAGTAAVIGDWDATWSGALYDLALEVAGGETEPVRSVVARVAIAFQLGAADPGRAGEVLAAALADAERLEALWELAHVLELVFDPRGRPDLDLGAAAPLLEAVLARVSDDDPRLPGVFGLPEIARCYRQLDPRRAVTVIRRWLAAASQAYDPDAMLEAALALVQLEPQAGHLALRQVAVTLAERLDCPGMSRFCAAAAAQEPGLAARVARAIPDSRERTRSLAAAAAATWETDRPAARALLHEIPTAAERSAALLSILDRAAGSGDLPRPVTDSEFNSCCSAIPRLEPGAAAELRAVVESLAENPGCAAGSGGSS